MKKLNIALAILSVLGATYVSADGDIVAASATITSNVPQTCKIGLWALDHDGSVDDNVDFGDGNNQFFHSELNYLTENGQTLTAKTQCNAPGGYQVDVIPGFGAFANLENRTADVKYTLSAERNPTGGFNFNPNLNSAPIAAGKTINVGDSMSVDVEKFTIKMSLDDQAEFKYAGQYQEVLNFNITPM